MHNKGMTHEPTFVVLHSTEFVQVPRLKVDKLKYLHNMGITRPMIVPRYLFAQ